MDTVTEHICEPHRVIRWGFSIKEGGTMANEITEEVEKVEEAKEIKIDLKVDKKKAEEAMKTLKDAFSGVSKTVDKISGGIKKAMGSMTKEVKSYLGDVGDAMTKAFTVTNMEEYAAAAERFGEGGGIAGEQAVFGCCGRSAAWHQCGSAACDDSGGGGAGAGGPHRGDDGRV